MSEQFKFEGASPVTAEGELDPRALERRVRQTVDALLPVEMDEGARPVITRFMHLAALATESQPTPAAASTVENLLQAAKQASAFEGVIPAVSFEGEEAIAVARQLATSNNPLAAFQDHLVGYARSRDATDAALGYLSV